MAVRWECPNGKHPGVLAPERPRKNDVRRYCLDCSKVEGVLVERTAPTLERKRAQTAAKTAVRAEQRKERAKLARLTRLIDAAGNTRFVDVEKETRRALKDCGYRRPSEVEISVWKRGHSSSGRAYPMEWPRPRIHISVAPGSSYERLMELVYHEAAHVVASPHIDRTDRRWHGPKFRRCLADGLQKRWAWLTYGSVNRADGAYAADDRIRVQMEEYIKAGGEL